MSSFNADTLNSKHEHEFARLRRSRSKSLFRFLLLTSLATCAVVLSVLSVFSRGIDEQILERTRRELLLQPSSWSKQLNEQQLEQRSWLQRHGTTGEREAFDTISASVFRSVNSLLRHSGGSEDLNFLSQAYLYLHFAVLRLAFVIIACWRLWLLLVGIACYFGFKSWRSYQGADLAGETGNNHLFYSGIRIGLDDLSPSGAPNKHVRGLVCLKESSSATIEKSALGKLLRRYEVANTTNLSLAGTILQYPDWPAYVSLQEEEALLAGCFLPASLENNCATILERILDLHVYYSHGQSDMDFLEYLTHEDEESEENGKIDYHEYSRVLQRAVHRVLTPKMREQLANIPAEQIATTILAYEAGKCMAFGFGAGRWMRVSNYPQLTARAVLHSVPKLQADYDFDQRMLIRHALIYGSRSGFFGPVKLPTHMSDESRALRQIVELLMACPHELRTVANEVELYGIVREAHQNWKQLIIDRVMTADPEVVASTYATEGNLFLMPITNVVKLAKQCLPPFLLKRLSELVVLVCQQQKLSSLTSDSGNEETAKGVLPSYARVFNPLTENEIRDLALLCKVSPDIIRDWSTLRIILNHFGWLGRRVGDYSVPESSIIYAVMRALPGHPDANEFGLIGVSGMVPLRGTQFEERWGKSWQTRFSQVLTATMAENKADFEKLMRGEEREELDEPTTANL